MKFKCAECKEEFPLTKEYFNVQNRKKRGFDNNCRWCRKKKTRANYSPSKQREYEVKRLYGITKSIYESMLVEQGYKCKICNRSEKEVGKALRVDHCHKTGKVRGLLCSKCNTLLGMAGDSVEVLKEAINYLKRNK